MTLGKLLKWIFVFILLFVITFLLGKFLKANAIIGFMVGVVWMGISIFIIGDRIPRDKLEDWKKFKKDNLKI